MPIINSIPARNYPLMFAYCRKFLGTRSINLNLVVNFVKFDDASTRNDVTVLTNLPMLDAVPMLYNIHL